LIYLDLLQVFQRCGGPVTALQKLLMASKGKSKVPAAQA
jgi:hypothetical protein